MSRKRISGLMIVMMTALLLTSSFIVTEPAYASSVTPAKPTVRSVSLKNNKITLSWKKAKGAKTYNVYVQTGKTGWKYWKKVKKSAANKKKYADTLKYKLKASGKNYKVYKQKNPFRIAAKNVKGTKYTFTGKYDVTYRFAIKAVNGKKLSASSAIKKKKIPKEPEKADTTDDLPYSDIVIYDEPIALINEYGAFLAADADNDTLVLSNKPYMWKLEQGKNGSHILSAKHQELMFDLDNAWYAEGTMVHLYEDTGHSCQYWNLTGSGSEGFVITSAQKPAWCVMSKERGFVLGKTSSAGKNDTWKIVRDGSWKESYTSPAEYPFYRYESSSTTPTPDFWTRFDAHGITDEMRASDSTGEEIYAQYAMIDPANNDEAAGYDFFSVDFYTGSQPDYTYWSLANWAMDSAEYMRRNGYSEVDTVGAYAGLQDTGEQTTKIMSMWESYFTGEDGSRYTLVPECVYPEDASTYFDNEGSGTSLVAPFDWKSDTWYRFVLRTWVKGDTTYAGTWIEDLSSGDVTLLAVYDTKLPDSFIVSVPAQFLENYSPETHGEYRQMKLRNYSLRSTSGEWYFPESAMMSIWASLELDNRGTYRFSTDGESILTETCGLGPDACSGKTDEDTQFTAFFRPAGASPDVSKYAIPEL